MAKRKTLQDLTIKDNFMFGAVMVNEDLCKELLELILGFPIEKITVDKEKSIIYHPEYKGWEPFHFSQYQGKESIRCIRGADTFFEICRVW